jgi:hypothetical protein
MKGIRLNGKLLRLSTVAAGCIGLVFLFPEWRKELQAHGGYPQCGEGLHNDGFGYCVSAGADTPPSDEYLQEGQVWDYRGNGVWVAECAEPVGGCKGRTYEAEINGSSVDMTSTNEEAGTASSGVNVPAPVSSPVDPPVVPPNGPQGTPPSDRPCAESGYEERLDTLASVSPSSPVKCEYYVYVRRFASPDNFGGGYHGDNRQATTSLGVTSRVSGNFILWRDGTGTALNVCSDPSQFMNEEPKTGQPMASLINGTSLVDGNPIITFSTAGSNPLVSHSPDIDTRLDLEVAEGSQSITLSGTLRGDPFPDAEVFIADSRGNSVMLDSYMTPLNPLTGPYVWLIGNRDLRLGTFKVTIPKGGAQAGLCSRS